MDETDVTPHENEELVSFSIRICAAIPFPMAAGDTDDMLDGDDDDSD
jgi:hypothetical protein